MQRPHTFIYGISMYALLLLGLGCGAPVPEKEKGQEKGKEEKKVATEKKQQHTTTKIAYHRTGGVVVIENLAAKSLKSVLFSPQLPFKNKEDKLWRRVYVEFDFVEGDDRHILFVEDPETVVFKGAILQVEECDGKTLTGRFGWYYTLAAGEPRDPGKAFTIEGTYEWKRDDGIDFTFREKDTDRLWKRAVRPLPAQKP